MTFIDFGITPCANQQHRINLNAFCSLSMNNSSFSPNASPKYISEENETGLKSYQYSLFVANVVICCISLIGNIGILVLICQRRLLGRTTNVFVFSLAMADAVCCIGAIPYYLLLAWERTMSVYLCKGFFYSLFVSRTAVSYTVILLTTEKILNILHPSRFITAGRCMFFISLVWFFSTAYNIWTVVFYTIYDYNQVSYIEFMMDASVVRYGKTCFFSHRFKSLRTIFLTIDFIMLFVIPCSIIAIEFIVILRKQHGTIKQRVETYYYIMRFIFFVFLVFIVCHLPFEIGTLAKGGQQYINDHVTILYEISATLFYVRGVLYLGVYMYFKQYVCRRSRRLNNSSQRNRLYLELPVRGHCRGLSLNEVRLFKWCFHKFVFRTNNIQEKTPDYNNIFAEKYRHIRSISNCDTLCIGRKRNWNLLIGYSYILSCNRWMSLPKM